MQSLTVGLAFAAAVLLVAHPLSADGLDDTERQIVQHVESHNDDALKLLERVVNINSGTMNPDGVREVGRVFARELEHLGFETRWAPGDAFDRAGHLIAERVGHGPHLLLIGHLDTVFELDSPLQRFERVDAHTARGPGVVDMKGGNVIIVYALRALASAGLLDDARITVVMTGDEERPGRPISAGRAELDRVAREADLALAFENGDNDPRTAVIARRGSSVWRIDVTAKAAHSMNLFMENTGAGAIYEASRILHQFEERMAGEPYLTFNPGIILGGTTVDFDSTAARGTAYGKSNIIAARATVVGDLRTLSLEQRERAKTIMREIVAKHPAHAQGTLRFDDGYPPMAPSDGNRRLLGMLDRVSRDLGLGGVEATDPGKAGAADVAFAALHVDMAIDGLGLLGSGDHTERETADLRTLPTQTQRAAVLIYRVLRPATAR